MRTQLAFSADVPRHPTPDAATCESAKAFRGRVATLGKRLAQAASRLYPENSVRNRRSDRFIFLVAAKRDALTASTAGGTIMVSDGLRLLCLDDAAVAFVIAREMGHVISRHHEENTGTSILWSIISQLLLPISASTFASYTASHITQRSYQPSQRHEADAVASALAGAAGWEPGEISTAFAGKLSLIAPDDWGRDLLKSLKTVNAPPAAVGRHKDAKPVVLLPIQEASRRASR